MNWPPYYRLDLAANGALPTRWMEDIATLAKHRSKATVLTGGGSTSRERSKGQRLIVNVVDGTAIRERLKWLWELYDGQLKEFSAQSFGRTLFPANLIHTAININVLQGRGSRYEWHVDSNPVTGLLFATTACEGDGGTLVFRNSAGRIARVKPKAGTFICFDAREMPHRVAPLRSDAARVSLPMNYYESATDQPRPDDLDPEIYGEK